MKKKHAILSLLISLITTLFLSQIFVPENHNVVLAIASPLATVSAMLFGFIVGSVTFLSSCKDSILIENMKEVGMYQGLMTRLELTGTGLILSCLFMVISIFLPNTTLINQLDIASDYLVLLMGLSALLFSLIEFWTCWLRISRTLKNM